MNLWSMWQPPEDLNRIQHFLTGRKQRVTINGKLSAWAIVLSGIPQGSVLGPILFVIFINDLPDMIRSTVKIFADDTKIFHIMLSRDDHHRIQANLLDLLAKWSEEWQLGFNEGKCKVLHLGNSNPKLDYKMNGISLVTHTSEKDLGVGELKFHSHIANAVHTASRMLGLVTATCTCLYEVTVPRLFSAMVRPHLEYDNVIWCPQYQTDSKEVEKIQ